MTAAQFQAFVDSLPDDLEGFNAALAGRSAADQAAFRARVMADVQGGSVQQDSRLGAGAWGLGQGAANVANGGTDLVIETVNLPMHALNLGFWLGGKLGGAEGLKVPTLHWDWSKNLVVAENQVDHDVSKIAGSVGVGAAAARYLPKAIEAVKRRFQKPVRTPVPEVPKGIAEAFHRGSGLSKAKQDLAVDVISGRKSRLELLRDLSGKEIGQAAHFFRQQANRVGGKFKNAARQFNLERARYLEQGGPQPPGNLADFMKRNGLTD